MTTTITAKGKRQKQALNWMLGKPLPEGYENVGLTHDEEWAMYVEHDSEYDAAEGEEFTTEVRMADAFVAPFLSECLDGINLLESIAADWAASDPVEARKTRAVATSLRRLVEREEAVHG